MPEATRLLLVDDHVIVRQGIAKLLSRVEGLKVIGEASDGEDAVVKARELRPDLILMDLALPGQTGLDATRSIARELPGSGVLVLTASDDDDDVYEAIAAGARGYILKTTDHAELVRQIRKAASGEIALSHEVVGKLAGRLSRRGNSATAEPGDVERLTDREKEVLSLVGQGARNKVIAEVLSISANTAREHVRNIMRKLELENRAQLAAYAVRHHLA
jgi:two-component system NarL family response regulator